MSTAIVYSALRSGSTMLRLMLNEHSELSCIGEHDYLFDHLRWDGQTWRYDLDALAMDRIFRSQELELPDQDAVDTALPQLLAQISRIGGTAVSVLMLHRNIEKAVALVPTVSVVHLLRDPRDVARSYVGMGWHGNPYCAVENWIETEEQWSSVSGKLVTEAIELRYEELVADPKGQLDRICASIGVAYEPTMLSYPERSTYSAPDARLAEQWRRKMPASDQRLVEARLGSLLSDRGYPSSGQPALTVSRGHDRLLRVRSALGRHMHAFKRFGFIHVQHIVGRKLSIDSLVKSAKLRKDDIVTEHYLR